LETIGERAFYGSGLKQVNYKGTMEEWIEVEKGEQWLDSTETTKVHCSDGILDVVDVKKNASAEELHNLGCKYFRGNGEKTDPNDLVAAELFTKAAEQGDEKSKVALKQLQQMVHEESATNNIIEDVFKSTMSETKNAFKSSVNETKEAFKKAFGGLFGKK